MTGTTETALPHYGTGTLTSPCVRADGRDVVYALQVPAATRVALTVTPLSSFDVVVNLVTDAAGCGNPAGSMTCLAGRDVGSAGAAEQLSFTNGGAARTVLVVVDGWAGRDFGAFAMSVVFQPILVGDTCEAPTALAPGAPVTGQSLVGFGDDYPSSFSGRCEFKSGVDRAYQVEVPAGQRLEVTVTPTGFDPGLSFLLGASSCAAERCVAGTDEAASGAPERLTWDNVSGATQQVLVVVDAPQSSMTASASFSISATVTASPPLVLGGATCAAPAALDAGTFISTTAGPSSQFNFSSSAGCEPTATAPDSVFSVTVPPSSLLRATVTPHQWDAVLNVLGSPGACGITLDAGTFGATCLTSSDGPRTTSVEEVVVRNPTATATTALLVVDGHTERDFGTFTITTEVVPFGSLAGDTCQAPQPLLMSGSLSGLTTTNYFNDVETATSCSSFQNRGADRVFSIVVPAGQQLTAVVIPNGWDASLYVLDPMACGLTASCFQSSDSSVSGAETVRFTNSGATDRTVFIVVDSYSATASGTFDLFTSLTP
ncbi:MAG: hypothetical protein IAE78_24055 [Myxococcus sp.]|nr:hypothetical protein [Myxococcus sp.]